MSEMRDLILESFTPLDFKSSACQLDRKRNVYVVQFTCKKLKITKMLHCHLKVND